jgi:hypothetical protein
MFYRWVESTAILRPDMEAHGKKEYATEERKLQKTWGRTKICSIVRSGGQYIGRWGIQPSGGSGSSYSIRK